MKILNAVGLAASSIAAAVAISACSGTPAADNNGGATAVVKDGTFKMALAGDPGALQPYGSMLNAFYQVIGFGYDNLAATAADGTMKPWLAKSWTSTTTKATFTLKNGITCQDGSPLTASKVAADFNWVANPENKSPALGVFVPQGARATADESTQTVTLTSSKPNPFLAENAAGMPIACDPHPATANTAFSGTGLYKLTKVQPGQSYTLTRRSGYTWGPDGVTSNTDGLPKTVELTVINDETTAANLILSGQLNAATIMGPQELQRLKGLNTHSAAKATTYRAEFVFNHNPKSLMHDENLRKALVHATDSGQVATILASGGSPGKFQNLSAGEPKFCNTKDLWKSAPQFDLTTAKKMLDDDGWKVGANGKREKNGQPLKIKLVYISSTATTAAYEYLAQQWAKIGVDLQLNSTDLAGASQATVDGNFDIIDFGVGTSNWPQIVPFFSGPTLKEGGSNYGDTANPDFDRATSSGMSKKGLASCDDWKEASVALVSSADILPIGWYDSGITVKGAQADGNLAIYPFTIRMTR